MNALVKVPEPGAERPEESPPRTPIWAEPPDLFFFRLGTLVAAGAQTGVEIVALAESGAIVRIGESIDADQPLALELNSQHRFPARVEWSSGDLVGLEFEDRAAVREILAARDRTHAYRPPRLKLATDVVLRLGDACITARALDVSEGGIKVDLDETGYVGREAGVIVPGMPPVAGRVKWCRGGRTGISFEQPLPFPSLADCFVRQARA
jgi:hypothetical protein